MLLRCLFLVLFIVVVADTIVNAGAAAARAAYHQREMTALRSGLSAAIGLAQQAAAGAASTHPLSTCAYASSSGCAMLVESDAALASPAPLPTASTCPAASCTVLLQNNSSVAEGRAAYVVSTRVLTPSGEAIASRSATVAFRTFAQPPYATLVGSLDATLDAALPSGAGDDGGNAAGTLIHVRYTGPAGDVPGDVWRRVDQRPAGSVPAWNP